MAIVNIGILVLSLRKYWKALYYSAFAFTWIIFTAWMFSDYLDSDLVPALSFATLFYIIFYIVRSIFKCVTIFKKSNFTTFYIVFYIT